MKKHYFVRTTSHNSARLGNCELCGKHCPEVFYAMAHDGPYHVDLPVGFGHAACLREAIPQGYEEVGTYEELRGWR